MDELDFDTDDYSNYEEQHVTLDECLNESIEDLSEGAIPSITLRRIPAEERRPIRTYLKHIFNEDKKK